VSVLQRQHSLSQRYLHIILPALILLLGIVCYANSFSVPMQFDDDIAVRITTDFKVELFSAAGFLRKARWLTDASFALNRFLHGEQPAGFHLVNLAIHLSSALMVLQLLAIVVDLLLRESTAIAADTASFLRRFIPFTVAALFVCHPLQTQAVTYIVQRYTSLATLFYLAALYAYLKAHVCDDLRLIRRWGVAAVVCALCSLKSKEIAATLPLMVILCEVLLFQGRLLKKTWFVALCSGLLLVIPLQLLFFAQSAGESGTIRAALQAASAETLTVSRSDYLLTQFSVVATYLRLLILPVRQNVDYAYPLYHTLGATPVWSGLLLHAGLLGVALFLWFRSKHVLVRDDLAEITMKLTALGIFWFYLALSVESSLIPIRDVIFEHRLYLPSVGFFLAAVAALTGVVGATSRTRPFLWGTVALLCLALGGATISRNRVWGDKLLLWQDVVAKSPDKARPRHTLGFLYVKRNQPELALPHLVRALEIDPGMDRYWATLNSAIFLMEKFRGRGAMGTEYLAGIDEVKPAFVRQWGALGYNNLGLAYEQQGNLYRAEESYRRGVELDPELDIGWYNLTLVLAARGEAELAASTRQRLAMLNPQLAEAAGRLVPGLLRDSR
jgi:hypothetical protein